ncbi:MAG: 50S ribosomal protein L18 [Pseudomonadota bacterium]|nr:50S ribosomal protein L18 [Pseudomonadota bacterium]
MFNKKTARIRRGQRTRSHIRAHGVHRLCVHRTPRHIYAQLIAPDGAQVLAYASTLERDIKQEVLTTGNVEAAVRVGRRLAERARSKGITRVAFDRGGFKYHGRVKALADAAREGGLQL